MKKLYGRKNDIENLKTLIKNEDCKNILLSGPSGIGKSLFLNSLKEEPQDDFLVLYYEVESRAHSKEHIYGKLTSQILEVLNKKRFDFKEFGRLIGDKAKKSKWNIGVSYLLNLLEETVPGVKGLKEGFYDQLEQDEQNLERTKLFAKKLVENSESEISTGLLCILQALSNNGIEGVLIIDRLESGSETFLDSLFLFIESIPDNWKVIFSINDEIPEGNKAIEYLWPKMTYNKGIKIGLQKITQRDLIEWKKDSSGIDIDLDLAGKVIEQCDGRPLFLEEWVESDSLQLESLSILARLGPHYNSKIRKLSPNARKLITALCIIPGRISISYELCKAILKLDGVLNLQVIEELIENGLLEYAYPENDQYKIKHELIRHYIYVSTPAALLREESFNLLTSISSGFITTEKLYMDYLQVKLLGNTDQVKGNEKSVLNTGTELLLKGSYKLSIELFDTLLSKIDADQLDLKMLASYHKATSLFELGLYTESLATLDNIESILQSDVLNQGDFYLLKGKNFLRLNQYSKAKDALKAAKDIFAENENYVGIVSTRLVINIILRDLELYEDAEQDAQEVLEECVKNNLPDSLLASCYSTLCRAQIYLNPEMAIESGIKAVALVQSQENIKKHGTANYALGEAYRHSKSRECLEFYNEALKIARAISHSDLLIWANLSLADAYFLFDDISAAKQVLDDLKISIRNSSEKYPLETLHFELSVSTILFYEKQLNFKLLKAAAKAYDKYGIKWPLAYIGKIKDNIKTPKRL